MKRPIRGARTPSRHGRASMTYLVLCLLLVGGAKGCECRCRPGGPGITVTDLPTSWINDSGDETTTAIKGRKAKVRVTIDPDPNSLLADGTGISVVYIVTDTGAEEFADATKESSQEYSFILPGSNELDLCEAMFYRWTVVYDVADSPDPGTYIGEQTYVMPSTHYPSPGVAQQALCATPTPP